MNIVSEVWVVKRPFTPKNSREAQSRRALISGTAGSVLERFDLAIYGTMSATVFPVVFFAGQTEETTALVTHGTTRGNII